MSIVVNDRAAAQLATRVGRWLVGAALLAGALTPAAAQAVDGSQAFQVWKSSIEDFAAADLKRRPEGNGVLFVGSSTIRLWTNLAQDFRQQPVVINRGFGGSTLAACNFFAKELVLQYRPSQVLVYAGDNDLAIGRSPEDVLDSFKRFTATVRGELTQSAHLVHFDQAQPVAPIAAAGYSTGQPAD